MSAPEGTHVLIDQWQQGTDREAIFRSLFERYHDPTFRLLRRRGFSVEEAQDIVQETFLRVHQNLDRYRPERPFGAWIFAIADNLGRKVVRRRGAFKRTAEARRADDVEPDARPTSCGDSSPLAEPALDSMLRRERGAMVRRAVDRLPAQMRRCVKLRVDHEMLYKEIAETLQIAESTVKVQLFKARSKLRDELGPHFARLRL